MRKISLNRAEIEAIKCGEYTLACLARDEAGPQVPQKAFLGHVKALKGLLAKVERASVPKDPGVNVGPYEDALVGASRKVIRTTGIGYSRASLGIANLGDEATPAAFKLVGEWIQRQGWLAGPVTILAVIKNWPDWYPKARATSRKTGTTEGLNGKDLGSGAAGGGRPVAPAGRREGFR